MQEVAKRVKELIQEKTKPYSVTEFAGKVGIPQTTFNQGLKRGRISLDAVLAIASKFPEVSLEWLIRGEGEMYGRPQPKEENAAKIAELERTNLLKDQVIQMKERQISDLQFQLAEKKDFVSSVKGVVKELARSAAHGCHTEEEQGIFKTNMVS